eukprot:scaffold4985_cov116-Isochrysis_galbana.AAC.7
MRPHLSQIPPTYIPSGEQDLDLEVGMERRGGRREKWEILEVGVGTGRRGYWLFSQQRPNGHG